MFSIPTVLNYLLQFYEIVLVFRIVLSWIPHNAKHPLVDFVYKITDPYLDLFRSLPLNFNGLDLSPMVAFFVLDPILKSILFRIFL